jgi:hypothetical protein
MKKWLRILISLGLMGYLLARLDWETTSKTLARVEWQWFIATVMMVTGAVLWSSLKWKVLCSGFKCKVPYLQLSQWYFIGSFFNNFLPTAVGGDAVRMTLMIRSGVDSPEAVASVFLERLTGFWMLVTVALAASLFFGMPEGLQQVPWLYGVLFFAMTAGVVIVALVGTRLRPAQCCEGVIDRIRTAIARHSEQILAYRSKPGILALAILMSIVFQLQVVATTWFIANALNIDVSFVDCLRIVPLATVATLLPVSFNGLGVRESMYVFLFGHVGVPREQAFLNGFGVYLAVMTMSLIGGMLYLRSEKNNVLECVQSENSQELKE